MTFLGNKKLLSILLLVSIILLIFQQTFISMVSIWLRSETFAHGFLIIPISIYLIWSKRQQLNNINAKTDFRMIPFLMLFGLLWMVSYSVDVLVIQQFSLIAMIVTMVWLLSGWPIVRIIFFPLGFLFFAVPIGEGLIPIMMDYTAIFTVKALRMSGIPVFWEGTFFSIPSGSWSVVEGCSGVRYLIASITLGSLYAYLSYTSFLRRFAFILLAICFPIVANWLRAYMIVMIAHLSDMKLALGVDHIIYGWVFFGIVMLLMFWIGTFWHEKVDDAVESVAHNPVVDKGNVESLNRYTAGLVSGLLAVSIWPAWAYYQESNSTLQKEMYLELPAEIESWLGSEKFTDWKPRYIKPTLSHSGTYKREGQEVGVYTFYYDHANQSAGELISSQNIMIKQKDPVWRELRKKNVPVTLDQHSFDVIESNLDSNDQSLLVWHWYWIGHQYVSNPYMAKFYELLARLSGDRYDGVGIVVYTRLDDRIDDARSTLSLFIRDVLPVLDNKIEGIQ